MATTALIGVRTGLQLASSGQRIESENYHGIDKHKAALLKTCPSIAYCRRAKRSSVRFGWVWWGRAQLAVRSSYNSGRPWQESALLESRIVRPNMVSARSAEAGIEQWAPVETATEAEAKIRLGIPVLTTDPKVLTRC